MVSIKNIGRPRARVRARARVRVRVRVRVCDRGLHQECRTVACGRESPVVQGYDYGLGEGEGDG